MQIGVEDPRAECQSALHTDRDLALRVQHGSVQQRVASDRDASTLEYRQPVLTVLGAKPGSGSQFKLATGLDPKVVALLSLGGKARLDVDRAALADAKLCQPQVRRHRLSEVKPSTPTAAKQNETEPIDGIDRPQRQGMHGRGV